VKIWLITIGEPLPTDSSNVRLYRTGILAELLAKKGHDVIWWTSSFDHVHKKFRKYSNELIEIEQGLSIYFIRGIGYKKNISLFRIIDHWLLKYYFEKEIKRMTVPDLILCSYPTIELAESAVRYGRRNNFPVLVDVRDLWPDIFLQALPRLIKKVGKTLIRGWFRSAKYIFSNCTAVLGVSENYMKWGLQYGKRLKTMRDRVFPLAYPAPSDNNSCKNNYDNEEILKSVGINPDKIIFLFVGTFGQTYDLSIVIKGIRQLDESELSNLQFVFCGNGECSLEWRRLANNIPQIVFTGWVDGNVLSSILSSSDIGIAAYKAGAPQGIPNKIIEYMSVGLPIISSLRGESDELIMNNNLGITYDATDSVDFVKCVRVLLDEEKRKQMSINAKSVFDQDYRADRVYGEFVSYLESFV